MNKKLHIHGNLGKKRSIETIEKHRIWANNNKEILSKAGKTSTFKKWFGHIAKPRPKFKGLWTRSKDPTKQLEKKRFTNQRYKARKRKADGTHTFGEWELLKKQYGFICPACKKMEPTIKLTEDHIIPLIMGGSDYIENIQPLCITCNVRKHTKTIKFDLLD
jgi:hypothetical protein